MRQFFPGVLDVYRFVLTASRVELEDHENLEIAEQVFLAASNSDSIAISDHFTQFKGFLSAIVNTASEATHILHVNKALIVDRFKRAVGRDPSGLLFDFTNDEVESRFRLAGIDPYLERALVASAIDHSAEVVWQFLLELLPSRPDRQDGSIQIFFNCDNWDGFGQSFPLFEVVDLIDIRSESKNV